MRRTRIVATIGPASSSPEVVRRLLLAGMDVARLNFSHGTHETHATTIRTLRSVAQELGRPLTILQDLQGPKIRTGELQDHQPVELHPGEPFIITTRPVVGTRACVSTTYTALPDDVRPGDRILLSDGLITLSVISVSGSDVHTTVIFGGELREKQGINLPGVTVSAPSLTDKDIVDLEFGLAQGVDYVALSFVRSARDIHDLKERISAAGHQTPIIAKIEKPEALEDMAAILKEVDGIMVARGDLGVEMPAEQVPLIQKQLIEAANLLGKPVITATQMLQSMVSSSRPTRAEASDVANAIIDGTDAVMLSGETATGQYPVESVETMARIAVAIEASGRRGDHHAASPWILERERNVPEAISAAACAIVDELPVVAIVALTQAGLTARMVARLRPNVPIYALTPDEHVYQRLNLFWGVTPLLYPTILHDLREFSREVRHILLEHGVAHHGDLAVLIGSHPLSARGRTNFVKVLEV